jgi:hypothetical protein
MKSKLCLLILMVGACGASRAAEATLKEQVTELLKGKVPENDLPIFFAARRKDQCRDQSHGRFRGAEVERRHILQVLQSVNGNRSDAAKVLGMARSIAFAEAAFLWREAGSLIPPLSSDLTAALYMFTLSAVFLLRAISCHSVFIEECGLLWTRRNPRLSETLNC